MQVGGTFGIVVGEPHPGGNRHRGGSASASGFLQISGPIAAIHSRGGGVLALTAIPEWRDPEAQIAVPPQAPAVNESTAAIPPSIRFSRVMRQSRPTRPRCDVVA